VDTERFGISLIPLYEFPFPPGSGSLRLSQRPPANPEYVFSVRSGQDRSADFQSAVSPNCIRQSVGSVPRAAVPQRLAECNSAIQQSTSLRYHGALNTYKPEVWNYDRAAQQGTGIGWAPCRPTKGKKKGAPQRGRLFQKPAVRSLHAVIVWH
jgi:hypothetical protein